MTTTNTNTNTINQNVNDTTDTTAATAAPKEFAKWEDLEDFNPELLRGIYAHGFDNPSIIQQKSILFLV
jgi:superfamily II DNA/RNA helicase